MSQRGWKRIALIVGGLVALEAGARIVAPGINVEVLTNYLRNGGGSWLLSLYNQLGGGALVRGGVLALGILPYFSARIFVRLARTVSSALEAMSRNPDGRATLTRWTRALTVGLAGMQSLGLARFVQNIPGAAAPGAGFVVQTVVVLTAGSVLAMLFGERIARAMDDDDTVDETPEPPRLAAPGLPETFGQRTKEEMPSRTVE